MSQRDPNEWMWERAAELLERADKVQRHFFHLSPGPNRPCWEPPIDVFETEEEITIVVALPGVDATSTGVAFEHGEIVVRAQRVLPAAFARGAVRRVEIPQGRFERRIALPAGRYELAEQVLQNGCLVLRIRKVNA